jgi:large subunit ribosomal protein L1
LFYLRRNRTEFKPKMIKENWRAVATDDVYPAKFYRNSTFTFEEAIEMHRETHHPTIYNCPNALVNLSIECNLHGEKKVRLGCILFSVNRVLNDSLSFQNKFLDKVQGNANIQHHFDQEIKRTIIMFSKNPEHMSPGLSAGAVLAGGVELVKGLQAGDVTFRNVDYVVATQEILPELAPIRGLFKLQYPNARHGND